MSTRSDAPARRRKPLRFPVIFHVTEMALPPPPAYDWLGRRRGRSYLVNMLTELALAGLAGAVSGAVIGFLAALLDNAIPSARSVIDPAKLLSVEADELTTDARFNVTDSAVV